MAVPSLSTQPAFVSVRFSRNDLRDINENDRLKRKFALAQSSTKLNFVCTGSQDIEDGRFIEGDIENASGDFAKARDAWLAAEEASSLMLRVLVSVTDAENAQLSARHRMMGEWRDVDHAFIESLPGLKVWSGGRSPRSPELPPERVQRLTSSFGVEAWQRLRKSTAMVVGAGGTGSVAIPMLARAGVGRIIIVDSDHITPSNLERTHASFPEHVERQTLKAQLANEHVRNIDTEIEIIAFEGRLPQREIIDEAINADIIIGCTDQHTSRMAISDIARRYLVPAIDCGGLIEGANGKVTGQIIQLVLFRPNDPCPVCRGMINPVRIEQELMSPSEREAIRKASTGSVPPQAHEIPQIDTVGYITTVSGTLAAGYAIGWLTGRFEPPFERLQMNLIADCLDVTNRPQMHDPQCACQRSVGLADDGAMLAPFAVPAHWKAVKRLA